MIHWIAVTWKWNPCLFHFMNEADFATIQIGWVLVEIALHPEAHTIGEHR